VRVTPDDLDRMQATHAVNHLVQARFKLRYADSDALDTGEHDLLAHALEHEGEPWILCSPDKAAIREAPFGLSPTRAGPQRRRRSGSRARVCGQRSTLEGVHHR
jgi:hypothetical protein